MGIGFIFPGQGAQEVGMLDDLRAEESILDERLSEASDILGFDLGDVIRNGPEARLSQTSVTQPALLVVSVALFEIWCAHRGAAPTIMAGHSLGEYSAFTAAGSLQFNDAVKLVHERGKLMESAVPDGQGAMAAILGLDDELVSSICDETDGVVSPANMNAPGQVVISGEISAVDKAMAECSEAGARRAVKLNVSGPFHCQLMTPAAGELETLLEEVEVKVPEIPVVHNVDASLAADAAGIRDRLVRQLSAPVRWTKCVETLLATGATSVVECGPGKVLTGLLRRIDRSVDAFPIGSVVELSAALDGIE
ncbi:MAG: ACP S-malonyltransferase [Pseudomonadota bacterium]|nr:ACP S-malonyltransferase [Pseudomonadota bacterium]